MLTIDEASARYADVYVPCAIFIEPERRTPILLMLAAAIFCAPAAARCRCYARDKDDIFFLKDLILLRFS